METGHSTWITTGAPVAVIGSRRNRVDFTTITRLTATQVILSDGSRWRRPDDRTANPHELRPVGHTSDWWTPRLRRADDPEAQAIAATNAVNDLRGRLDRLTADFGNNTTGSEAIIAAAHAVLAEVAAAVATAAAALPRRAGHDLHVDIESLTVSVVPVDHPQRRHLQLFLRPTPTGTWMVTPNDSGMFLADVDGQFVSRYEAAEHPDGLEARCHHPWERALSIASSHAHNLLDDLQARVFDIDGLRPARRWTAATPSEQAAVLADLLAWVTGPTGT